MRTDNLRSPLAAGLLSAVAATAFGLPSTTAQLASPSARVVSDAHIRLATCQKGPNGLAQLCFSQSTSSAGDIITDFTVYGPAGGTATLVNTTTEDSIEMVLTGPLGRTATFYYQAYYEADQGNTLVTAYFTGPRGHTINYSAQMPGGGGSQVEQSPDLNLTLTNYSGVSADTTVQPNYTSTRRSVFSSRTNRSAAARADVTTWGIANPGSAAVRSVAASSAPAAQAPASASAETSDSTPTAKPVTQRTARKAAR